MKILLLGINSKYIHPAMGILQLKSNADFFVDTKEFTIKDDISSVVQFINEFAAGLIGISVYIWNASFIKQILSKLPEHFMVVLGGPEASFRIDEFFRFPCVKYIIKNEGEESFVQLISHLKEELPINNVSNLYYRQNGICFTYEQLPDITKIKHDYKLIGDAKNRYVYLETSRGCPYQCAYCLASLDQKVRFFPMDQVKKEILWAINQQAKTVKFLDRTFNANKQRMMEIISFIQEHDNHVTIWQMEIVADIIDDELIAFLKQVRPNLLRFEIGIQSTNEQVTKAVLRKQMFEKIKNVVREIQDCITIHLDLIAGLPYEDKHSFANTFNETFFLFADELQLGILKALAGTRIVAEKQLHQYVFSNEPPYEIIQNTYLSREDLEEIKLVETGLNRYYNSHRFPRTMSYLFLDLKLNPYETFLTLGKYIKEHSDVVLQLPTLAKSLYLAINVSNQDYFLFLIKQDYLSQARYKPPIWWEIKLTKQEKNEILNQIKQEHPKLLLLDLSHNSRLEKYENNKECIYFLILYEIKQTILYHLKKD